ncbi:hypothetical protein K1T35_47525 (plasmid) [Pseudonocardia sp. DSM 110487]|uniref:hypothetical protein n=1 Tax=Pseudonocardia sp. DSM 110487 TaxID=2865833 RepID=UPI001C6A008B|nr:hypothetical protein [Pseudonocardia sp. DSM 110487]QYN41001.1 hypothetical protein K1T35_47525 [Pseudonocardia sp. DSM 110487]
MTKPYRWQDDRPLDGCEFAARLRPGTTVLNSMYRSDADPQVINVAHVEINGDEMVTIHDVSGYAVTTCADLCLQVVTSELADLIDFVMIAERDRDRE